MEFLYNYFIFIKFYLKIYILQEKKKKEKK